MKLLSRLPQFIHASQGTDTLRHQLALAAVAETIEQHFPHVIDALAQDVYEPHRAALTAIGTTPANSEMSCVSLRDRLEQHAKDLALPIFRKHKPAYDPLQDLLMSGIGFSSVQERDILAAEILEDAICADIAANPQEYDPCCRFLGEADQEVWTVMSAADDSCSEFADVRRARNAIVDWFTRYGLNGEADILLHQQFFGYVAAGTVVEWAHSGDGPDKEFYGSWGPPPRLPMCQCTRPRVPGWYTHSILRCPQAVERYGPRPQQRNVAKFTGFPKYDPVPDQKAAIPSSHNREHHKALVSRWFDEYLAADKTLAPYPDLRAEWKRRVKNDDEEDCDDIEAWLLRQGWEDTRKLSGPDRDIVPKFQSREEMFKICVAYHVDPDKTQEQIAADYGTYPRKLQRYLTWFQRITGLANPVKRKARTGRRAM